MSSCKRSIDQRSDAAGFDEFTSKRIKITDTDALLVEDLTEFYTFSVDTSNKVVDLENLSLTVAGAPLLVRDTGTSAFLVTNSGTTSDIFNVDTTTPKITCGNTTHANVVWVVATTPSIKFSLDNSTAAAEIQASATNLTFLVGDTQIGTATSSRWTSSIAKTFNFTSTTALILNDTAGTTPTFTVNTSGNVVTVDGNCIIDNTNTTALLVRKNASGGNIFTVDTSTPKVFVGNATDATVLYLVAPSVARLRWSLDGSTSNGELSVTSTNMTFLVGGTQVATTTGTTWSHSAKMSIALTSNAALVVKDASSNNALVVDSLNHTITYGNTTQGCDSTWLTTAATGTNTLNFNDGVSNKGSIKYDMAVGTGGGFTLSTNGTSRMTLSSNGANFINPVQFPAFTAATLPSATTVGRLIYVSDDAIGPTFAMADGTNWRRLSDLTITGTGATTFNTDLKQVIDVTDAAALTVRKNASGGDVFNVDTSGSIVRVDGDCIVDNTSTTALVIRKNSTGGNIFNVDTSGNIITIGNTTNGSDVTLLNTVTGTTSINFNDGSSDGIIAYDHNTDTMKFTVNGTQGFTLGATGPKNVSSFLYKLTTSNTSTASSYIGDTNYPTTNIFNNGTAFGAINSTTGQITVNEAGVYMFGYSFQYSALVGTNIEAEGLVNNVTDGLSYAASYNTKTPASSHSTCDGVSLVTCAANDAIRFPAILTGAPLTSYSLDAPHSRIWGYKVSS